MAKKAVVLISGGIDSSTVLSMIQKDFDEIHAMSFGYGQRHDIELIKAKEIAKQFKVTKHKIVNIDLGSFGGSALTDESIDVPKYEDSSEVEDNIPISYVPARNTIFLSYALGYAEVIEAHDIFIGVHATDHSNYPDCRKDYVDSFEQMANLATKAGRDGTKITIHTPIIDKTKDEIVKIGLDAGVDYSKTISCYDPVYENNADGQIDALSCGKCLACVVRLEAFAKNGCRDPIRYVSEKES